MSRPEPLEDRALQPRSVIQKMPPAMPTEEDNVSTTDDSEGASDVDSPSETTTPVGVSAGVVRTTVALKARCVHFDEEAHQVFEVIPYREIFGVHPRLFDFDKDYSMVPSKGQPTPAELLATATGMEDQGDSSDDDWDEDIEWDEVWTLSTTPLAAAAQESSDCDMGTTMHRETGSKTIGGC
jgi:hypothetical protein